MEQMTRLSAKCLKLPKLEPHLHELPAEVFGSKIDLIAEMGRSNDPIATMVTCWELGGILDQVSHTIPGKIMVVQNPGGLVAAAGADAKDADSESDSVLYCLHQPTVKHLIVCGHTKCKTLAALVGEDTEGTMDIFRQSLECVTRRFEEIYVKRPAREWLRIIAQESVLQQLANLCVDATIRSRLSNGSLRLHGWMRDDETSVVVAFDPASGQFSD
jgi:carbonic anhydrase